LEGWDYRVTLFVRKQEYESATNAVSKYKDVSVKSIDGALFSWNWAWSNGKPINLLR
jgi:hypothetical protein